jgi:DNA-binding NtrC family response regulator
MNPNSEFSIFLVDDDPFFLNVCEQYLHNLGYSNISQFQSSTEFINNLQKLPDLVLLDYNMDSLNGIETLKKIKRFNPNALVVFISGQEKIDVAVNALKYGALDYILKNEVTEERLKTVLEKGRDIKNILVRNNKKSLLKRLLPFIGMIAMILLANNVYSKF